MITFKNKGEIDPLAITTLGINAKAGENPIGYFGTGLKYAIAVILRLGGRITIHRGLELLEFSAEDVESRGKAFQVVCMNGARLGFTTELGKNWEPWMAYRELYCNALDEGGVATSSRALPEEGYTTIQVSLDAFEEAHAKRASIVLESTPFHVSAGIELHRGQSNHIYYRGILAGELEQPSEYTYNIITPLVLTEDRTIKSMYNAVLAIRHAVINLTDMELLKTWLQAPRGTFENKLDLNYFSDAPAPEWLRTAQEVLDEIEKTCNLSLGGLVAKHTDHVRRVRAVELTAPQEAMLQRSINTLKLIGYDVTQHEIVVVETLGTNVLGRAADKRIYLSKQVFDMGTKMVAGTLLEEHLHLALLFQDETRDLQNYLINQIMTLAENHVLREAL